jgi:hypothetical protein
MRSRPGLALASLALLVVAGFAPEAASQGRAAAILGDSSTLTVDVVPLQAEVRLNGVRLGSAHDLVARAIPVIPGEHVLDVAAPGYIGTRVWVLATADWSTRVWLQLVPDRGR